MIYEEDIEKAGIEFEAELSKGIEVARNNGINLTKFKIEILKGLTTQNDEDDWTFDYESYLAAIARGNFQTPLEWGEEYYFGRWSTQILVVDSKIKQLLELSDEFIFPAFYTHTNKQMWKISNPYTHYGSETLVLCGVDEGIDTALDLAIEHISKAKDKFYNSDNNA